MASQCDMVLDHLKNHGSISHREAEELYGIARLAARINDLRRCKCGSNNAAYVRGSDDLWRVRCFDCGETRGMDETRHGAQVKWNGGCR